MAMQMSSPVTETAQASALGFATIERQHIQEHPRWAKLALRQLTAREREILPLLAARWTDREIADALCISYRTVTTHVSHIFDKLGVNSRRAAAEYARLMEAESV